MNATEPTLGVPLARLGRAVLRRVGLVQAGVPDAYGAPQPIRLPEPPAAGLDPLSEAALDAAAEEAIRAAGLEPGAPATPMGLDALASLPLTRDNVEAVLEEMVRPALNADGGDIQLIEIDEHDNVHVKLVGACSSCPSSIMTMKMGVERLLQDEFPTMGDLIQVDAMPVAPHAW